MSQNKIEQKILVALVIGDGIEFRKKLGTKSGCDTWGRSLVSLQEHYSRPLHLLQTAPLRGSL